jgi:dihydrofolate reductase
MGSLVLSMSMSLDGFIAGPGDSKGNPFGTKGHRLHEWLGDGGEDLSGFRPGDEPSQTVFAEMMSTGAVITGRRTGDYPPTSRQQMIKRPDRGPGGQASDLQLPGSGGRI